jgi:hypothetical protein
MAYEPKDGSGVLFKNEKKKDTHPDYRGDIMVGGKQYELAAWIKEGKKGKFMSLSAKPKAKEEKKGSAADLDDDIPFAPIGKLEAMLS